MSKKNFITICRGFGKTSDEAKEDAYFKASCEGHDPESLEREWFRCNNGNVGCRLYAIQYLEDEGNKPHLKAAIE